MDLTLTAKLEDADVEKRGTHFLDTGQSGVPHGATLRSSPVRLYGFCCPGVALPLNLFNFVSMQCILTM